METVFKHRFLMLLAVAVQSQAVQADLVATRSQAVFSSAETALPEELDHSRGREGINLTALNNMNLQATVSGNQAINNVSGYNVIDRGAFAEASGITSVIQNSGNNVVIQDSTIVNVTIVP